MFRTLLAAVSASIGLFLLTPVLLLGLPFLFIAATVRTVQALLVSAKPRIAPWQQLIEYCPTVGWKPKPNMNTYAYADKPFHVTTDSEGWRGRTALADSDIVVFGDSYAFGYGVSDRAFFAELDPEVRIKCIGVNGYNMVQSLLWMRRLAPKLAGKLVVWFIYHGNDLYENLQPNLGKYRMPFVRESGPHHWEIVTDHVNESPWEGPHERNYYSALAEICTPTSRLSQRAFSACQYLIEEADAVCAQVGARLMVMSIPDITQISGAHMGRLMAVAPDRPYFDPTLPDARLAAICDRVGVGFARAGDHLRVEDHKQHDAHWNEQGHRRFAKVLKTLYREATAGVASAA